MSRINFKKLYNIMSEWTWQELAFGLNKGIIEKDEIILYTKKIIDDDTEHFDLVLELIIDENIDSIEMMKILLKINSYEKRKQDNEEIESKWIFACVYYGYIYHIEEIYSWIEDMYIQFDYTEELKHMVGWRAISGNLPPKYLETYILNGKNKYILS